MSKKRRAVAVVCAASAARLSPRSVATVRATSASHAGSLRRERGVGLSVRGKQIGRVGLEHQPAGRNARHCRLQRRAAPLVTDPSGDADVQIELETGVDLGRSAGEAVRHGPDELRAKLAHHRDEVAMCVTLVQEDRSPQLDRQLELTAECRKLGCPRREIAIVVETAFTDGNHARVTRNGSERAQRCVIEFRGVMRMNAGGGREHAARQLRRQCDQRARRIDGGPGADELHDTGLVRALDDGRKIGGEAVVRQVDADVDQLELLHGGERLHERGWYDAGRVDRLLASVANTDP